MSARLDKISDFFSHIFKLYKELLENTTRAYPLRILDEIKDAKTGKIYFITQLVGKKICPKIPAEDLAKDDKYIECFSPRDVKRIMSAAFSRPSMTVLAGGKEDVTHRILQRNFTKSNETSEYLVEHDTNEGKIERLWSASELFFRKNVLLKFAKRDISDISYTAGVENVLKETLEIENAKQE